MMNWKSSGLSHGNKSLRNLFEIFFKLLFKRFSWIWPEQANFWFVLTHSWWLLSCLFSPWISKRLIYLLPVNREADQHTARGLPKITEKIHGRSRLSWPLLTTLYWSSAEVWDFISELVKSAAFTLCYTHEAVRTAGRSQDVFTGATAHVLS